MSRKREDEFSRYVRARRPSLRRTAFLLVNDWHEADDLVQKTLVAVYRRWDALDRREALAAYTRRAMLRQFISERRSKRWSREFCSADPPEPPPAADETAGLPDRLVLLNALAELAPRQRAAVVLRYWEDLSVDETAHLLKCSPATIRSQTTRALATLRAALGSNFAADRDKELVSPDQHY
jgi:RNA polymerase sigma-70 factor (sigma-E family)